VSRNTPFGPLRRDDAVGLLLANAQQETRAGRLSQVCAILHRALDVAPESLPALSALVDCFIDQRRWSAAVKLLRPTLDLARRVNDPGAQTELGQRLAAVLLQANRRLAARSVLQQVLRVELESRGVLSATTLVLLSRAMQGKWSIERRWRLLRGSSRVAHGAERVMGLSATGRLFLESGNADAALRAFDEAVRVAIRLKLPPARRAAAVSDQGLALVKAGRYLSAVGVLRRAAKLHAKVGNTLWARKLARLANRTLRAQQRLDEIAERN
jgi:tetratricopeptide (TPR) repeat protein